MDSSLDFTTGLTYPKDHQTCRYVPYDAPQYLIAKKVNSTTGSITDAECLVTDTTGEQQNRQCTLSVGSNADEKASVTLDFEVAVAGIPVIQVSLVTASSTPVLLDITFSEGYPGILRNDGDGPFPFSAGADTLRRSRFRITYPGFYESKYVQGSQRWMKVTLVSSTPCSVSLSLAGFKPTTSNTPLDQLPGHFECSDSTLNDLWGYGARTLQLNCIPARTIPPPWQVSEDMGILIDSQRCNAYGWGSEWTDYEVNVEGMIIHGGLSWNVRAKGGRPGLLFNLSLSADGGNMTLDSWFGYYEKRQTTLIPILISHKELPDVKIVQNHWCKIKTICVGLDEILVYVDGVLLETLKQGDDATC